MKHRLADHLVPSLDRDLRGQDCGGTLVAIVDDLHRVVTLLGGKPGPGPIVEDEQLDPGELGEQPGGLAIDAGKGELVEKPGQPLIAHREPVTRGLVAEGASDETLAGTGRAQDQDVVVLVQPTAAGEAVDQAAVETARGAVVDILEAGDLTQPGKAQALGERGVVAFDGLAIDQHRQALVEAEAITVGQACCSSSALAMPVRRKRRNVSIVGWIMIIPS
jgi:hypothetical protein